MKNFKTAFTLIEITIVIAIIAMLVGLSVVSYEAMSSRSRDQRRVSDIRRLQIILEEYRRQENKYPDSITAGSQLVGSTTSIIFSSNIPTAPAPGDGDCTDAENSYVYTSLDSGNNYKLRFCLGSTIEKISANLDCATPLGITSGDCQ